MNAEFKNWIEYAAENLQVATLCLESGLFNSALQNSQQCVEKALKARLLFLGRRISRTHAIKELCTDLQKLNITAGLSKDECELMDSIYLPSKYPLGSVFSKY